MPTLLRCRAALFCAAATFAVLRAQQDPDPTVRVETWADGSVRARFTVDEQGRRHGSAEEFTSQGVRTCQTTYVHGKQEGVRKEWAPDGIKTAVLTFRTDQLDGPAETFFADGRTQSRGSYRAGKRTGAWMNQDEHGERRRTATYRDGVLHGDLLVQEGASTLSRQRWRNGELAVLDDLKPFPRARGELLTTLRALLDAPVPKADGDAKQAERHAALQRLRVYRNLCSLPEADLELVPKWNDLCDAAAEVCRANGHIDHFPAEPPGFDHARFVQGAEGARNSNLAQGGALASSVDSYLDDSDPSNIDRIGHRRWCLNPSLGRLGFGTSEGFHAMWSMDGSGKPPRGLDAVIYPPPGWVPGDLFDAGAAFSIALLRSGAPKAADLGITIRELDADFVPTGEPLELDHCAVIGGGQGTGPVLCFRAKGLQVVDGQRYLVDVRDTGAKKSLFTYLVAFCEPLVAAGDH